MNLFGFQIRRTSDEKPPESFAPPVTDDGATVVTSAGYGGAYGTVLDLEGSVRGEAELITKYRGMAKHPEVIAAINEIVNEAMVSGSETDQPVSIDLDDLDAMSPDLRQAFVAEFDAILRLLEFNTNSYEIFKRWYVDGRIYFHMIIDKDAPQLGIQELRYIDPRKIKKVREVQRKRAADGSPVTVQKTRAEYYVYNESGFDAKSSVPGGTIPANYGLKIAKDAIVYVTSGLLDERGMLVLSHLDQAIRPLNMLRTMEDSAVIYRLVRAPERRVWYIDVGNMPKHKAEQAIYDMMVRHKNKLVYDPSSGNVTDQRKHVTMLEDIWLSRREGNRGTEVITLPGSQNLGQMEEVDYFLKKLYKSLNVPISRLEPEIMYTLGREQQITRDEVNFTKFIDRLRSRFVELFLDIMEKQLILKGYIGPDDWKQIRPFIKFKYASDEYFSDMKENEVLLTRLTTLQLAMPYVGRFFSNKQIRQQILKQTEEEIDEINEEILEERLDPIYMVQIGPDGLPLEMMPGLTAPPNMIPPPEKPKPKAGSK